MSAAQSTGRKCHCGCMASLDGMGLTAKWARGCNAQKARARAYKKKWEEMRIERRKAHMHPIFVRRTHEEREEAKGRPRIKCKLCCDDPSNRSPHREADPDPGNTYGIKYVGEVWRGEWRCRSCYEPYGEPEPIEQGSLYHSSAAMAVDLSNMYGYQAAILSQGDVSLSHPRKAKK